VSEFRDRTVRVKETDDVPFVLAANKCDLPDSKREVTKAEGQDLAKKYGMEFYETRYRVCISSVC
jgi:GTPase SAR1 family protein